MSHLFTPYRLGPVTLRNRTIRSAAFESMGKDFGPTQQLKDYHVSVARGGVGMTTLAYAAVSRSGLSFNKQLWLRPAIVPGLRDITAAIHAEGAAAGIQIGHCGNMTHLSTRISGFGGPGNSQCGKGRDGRNVFGRLKRGPFEVRPQWFGGCMPFGSFGAKWKRGDTGKHPSLANLSRLKNNRTESPRPANFFLMHSPLPETAPARGNARG